MTSKQIKIILITVLVCVALIMRIVHSTKQAQAESEQQIKVITPFELQQQLKNLGYYHGNVDGIIGKETNEAWGRCYNDQMQRDWNKPIKAAKR